VAFKFDLKSMKLCQSFRPQHELAITANGGVQTHRSRTAFDKLTWLNLLHAFITFWWLIGTCFFINHDMLIFTLDLRFDSVISTSLAEPVVALLKASEVALSGYKLF
jgi:hypothetical protein